MNHPSAKKKPFTQTPQRSKQIEAERKKQLDKLFCERDDLSLRIEMARMSGLALQLSTNNPSNIKHHPLINHIIRDLKQLYQVAPREAAMLRERLIFKPIPAEKVKIEPTFQGKLSDAAKPHISNLAVR